MKEINITMEEVNSSFDKINQASFKNFEDLYTETGGIDQEDEEIFLDNIPSIINLEENKQLF
jgi:hypothetical protein